MGSSLVQTPINKINSEFVDRATQIIDLIYAHLDAEPNCPHCLELLKIGLVTSQTTDDTVTNPEPTGVSQCLS